MMNLKVFTISERHLGIAMLLSVVWGNLILSPLKAQTPSQIPTIIPADVDDLPNNTDQMKTWSCNQENQQILVEVKMVKNWQEIMEMETNQWQCQEQLVNIPDNAIQFSCESDENTINLITVTWIKGNEGKSLMKNWINTFENQSMACTVDRTNPFWN
jgi:NADH dehydrogenase FAD-containing subunit